jgi:peptidyl-dipeptidase Dcp
MQDTMAKTPERAHGPDDARLAGRRRPREGGSARQQAIARKLGQKITIEPWDYRYYQEKVRKERYDLSQDEIKPYFELSNMINGMFWAAGSSTTSTSRRIPGTVPVWHPDVRTFEVTDRKTARCRPVLHRQLCPQGKRSGAWATTYRSRSGLLGDEIVLGSNNNNFTKPGPGEPVLISLDDARDAVPRVRPRHPLFPVGRALSEPRRHAARLRGISEPGERELAADARGAQPLRQALQDRPADAAGAGRQDREGATFNQGFATVEYLSSALVDMALHTGPGRRGRSRRVRARDADPARHAQGDGDAAPPAAVQPPLLVRRLFGRLLFLPLVGDDGRRHLGGVRGAGNPLGQGDRRPLPQTLLSTGNETDRAEAYRASSAAAIRT